MFDMTPEQQAQIIGIFIVGLGAVVLWFRARLKQNAEKHAQDLKEQADLHEQRMKDYEANREKEKQELNLRLVELEQNARTEDRLFELNRAHANSYDMVAHSIDRQTKMMEYLAQVVSDQSSQIEIFSQQLKVAVNHSEGVTSNMTNLSSDINIYIKETKDMWAKFQALIANILGDTREEHKAQLHTIFSEISAITRILNLIQEQNDITQKIPPLPEPTNGNPADDTDNENQPKEDIA